MKNRSPEDEYRFDLVKEGEWKNCFSWELHRECCNRDGRGIYPPWLKLSDDEKASFRGQCPLDYFPERSPVIIPPPPPIHGAHQADDGTDFVSAEVVTLNITALVNWESSDPQIIDGFKAEIAKWLKGQRQNNPNAKRFIGKADRGAPKKPLSALLKLATWRLERRYGIVLPEIEKRLSRILWLLDFAADVSAEERQKKMDQWEREGRVASLLGNKTKYVREMDALLQDPDPNGVEAKKIRYW